MGQHIVAAFQRAGIVAGGAVARRGFWQDGEIAGLWQGELIGRFGEIGLGSGFDAIGVAAEENLVEVKLEDLLFGELLLDPAGEDGFAEFAADGDFIGEQQVFCDLLGDSGGADRALVVEEAADEAGDGGGDAGIIQAIMGEEGFVFSRDEGLDDEWRHFGIGQIDAAFAGETVNGGAVCLADGAGERWLIAGEAGGIGQAANDEQPEEKQENEAEDQEDAEGNPDFSGNGAQICTEPRQQGGAGRFGGDGIHLPVFSAFGCEGVAGKGGVSGRKAMVGGRAWGRGAFACGHETGNRSGMAGRRGAG